MKITSWIERFIYYLCTAVIICCTPSVSTAYSQPIDFSLYNDLQAAYIFNIAKFIDWPAASGPKEFKLCILDDDKALFELLQEKVGSKTIKNQKISVAHISSVAKPESIQGECHMVYINRNIGKEVIPAARKMNDGVHSIIWVSSPKAGSGDGALIELELENKRMVIYVNKAELERAQFKVRSSLLSVSRLR